MHGNTSMRVNKMFSTKLSSSADLPIFTSFRMSRTSPAEIESAALDNMASMCSDTKLFESVL